MSSKVFNRFVEKAPFDVMTRVLAQEFIGDELNRAFDDNREVQYDDIATFEAIAATLADVALNFSNDFIRRTKITAGSTPPVLV